MKAKLLIGLATLVTLTSFQAAMAAGNRVSMHERIKIEKEKRKKLSEYVDLRGTKTPKDVNNAVSEKLAAIAIEKNIPVDQMALSDAVSRTVKTKITVNGKLVDTNVNLLSVARDIFQVDAAIKLTREDMRRGTLKLDAAETKVLETTERGVVQGIRVLSLESHTSETSTVRNADTQQNLDVLHKEVVLVPEVLSDRMTPEQATSHIDIYELAADAKVSRETLGDVAMDQAFKKKHGKEAEQREKDTKDCM